MRFMIIVKSTEQAEAGIPPDSADIAAMGRFNEKLIDAGIMLAGEGLMASRKGARIKFEPQGKQTIVDGPFAEAKELVAGFWIIRVDSFEDAMKWARMAPMNVGDELEVRQVFEVDDFESDAITEEHLRKEQAFRDATVKPITR
jgi:hypothetical protein